MIYEFPCQNCEVVQFNAKELAPDNLNCEEAKTREGGGKKHLGASRLPEKAKRPQTATPRGQYLMCPLAWRAKTGFFRSGGRTMVLLVVFGALAAFLLILHLKNKYSYAHSSVERMFPGPREVPFFGNSLEFMNKDSEGSYNWFQKICSNYPRFTRIWLGHSCYIILYEAKDVEVLLSSTSQIQKSNVYRFLYDWIGTGLLTSSGAKWKSHRKIITPTFHFKILEDFVQIFNSNGSILIDKLSQKAGKGTFNIYNLINLYTLDNICETALGVQINAQKDSESQYARAVKDIRNVVSLRTLKVWLAFDFILHLTNYGAIYKEALNVLHKTTDDVIRMRRKELKESPPTPAGNEDIDQKRRLAFLDLLILSGEMSDHEIREEVDTFLFEGHDTVTSGISFALYALAHNQEVQEAAYKEQLEIFENSNRDPTWQDLQNMKYLEMVLKESQRVYPSVPLIGRAIDDDLHLGDGYFLPKGTYCTINVAKLHMDPKTWPNPEVFNPDNFLPEAARGRNPYAFIPFSAGPRNCIGQRFAMMEMKSCVGKVLRKFKINPSRDNNNNARVAGQLVLSSSNGINIELEHRN